jgi:hypothetical protein
MSVRNASAEPCLIPGQGIVALVDHTGAQLVAMPPSGAIQPIRVDSGASVATDVIVGNWCRPAPAFPVVLAVALIDATTLSVGQPIANRDGLPPCNGSGPATIRTTANWTAP